MLASAGAPLRIVSMDPQVLTICCNRLIVAALIAGCQMLTVRPFYAASYNKKPNYRALVVSDLQGHLRSMIFISSERAYAISY